MFSKTQCLGSNSTSYKNGQPYFPYNFPVPTYASSSVSTKIFSLPFSTLTTPTQDSTGTKTITASTSPAVSIVANSNLPTGKNAFSDGTLTCSSVSGISDGNWSISFWAKLASTDLINYSNVVNTTSSNFFIKYKRNNNSSTSPLLRVYNKKTDNTNVYLGVTMSADIWYFYTITCKPEQMTIFVNGSQLTQTTSDTINTFQAPSSTFSFSGSSSIDFPCQLSDITIYKSTLTQNQVYNLLFSSPTFSLPFNSNITPTKDSTDRSLPLVVSGVSISNDTSLKTVSPSSFSFNKGAISCATIPVTTFGGGWSCSFWIKMNPTSSTTYTYALNSVLSDYRFYVSKNSSNSDARAYFDVKYTDGSGYLSNGLTSSSFQNWNFLTFCVTSTTIIFYINNYPYTITAATGKTLKTPSANMLFTASDICKLSNITIFDSYLVSGQVQNLYTVAKL